MPGARSLIGGAVIGAVEAEVGMDVFRVDIGFSVWLSMTDHRRRERYGVL